MPVRLKVLKNTPPFGERVFEMEKDVILIGKDPKNEIHLEGTSFVSRQHAKLVRHGDTYSIVDLNSRNGTILNGNRIKPNLEHPLKNGDLIYICEFVIEFSAEQPQIEPEEGLFPKPEVPSPFVQESKNLVAALDQMCRKFEREGLPLKEAALQEALRDSLSETQLNRAAEILSQVLQARTGAAPSPPPPAQIEQPMDISSIHDRVERAISILLDFFVKMIQALNEFEIFFLDKTITTIILQPKSEPPKSGKPFSLVKCTPKELKEYLFDPGTSSEEAQERIQCIQSNAEKLMMHQISLLAGYKASVIEGSQKLLQTMNPRGFQKKLAEKTAKLGPLRLRYHQIPFLAAVQIVKELARTYQELEMEDPAKIEEAFFHNPYKKGYQKSMNKTPGRSAPSD